MISIAWSAARSRNVWVVRLAGQVTVSAATRCRVEQADDWTRLLPPELELLPTVR